jgi:hypothetical protein
MSSCQSKINQQSYLFGGSNKQSKRIDFTKIKWGSFTKKYNSYIRKHPHKKSILPDLKHFAQYVNKYPTNFNKKTHKRALFYKNVILRKRK